MASEFTGSWQLLSTSTFTFLEKYLAGISAYQHDIPATANGHGIIKNLDTSYRSKLVNYALEEIQENLLSSSSARCR
jgi:hypothetical protein